MKPVFCKGTSNMSILYPFAARNTRRRQAESDGFVEHARKCWSQGMPRRQDGLTEIRSKHCGFNTGHVIAACINENVNEHVSFFTVRGRLEDRKLMVFDIGNRTILKNKIRKKKLQ